MLAGLLYEDSLSFFRSMDHSCGLFPDDVLEILEGLGLPGREVGSLPRRQPALVAVEWRDVPGGHYLVWDPERRLFLDPLFGLLPRKDVLTHCRIDHIWSVGRKNMRRLVAARIAQALAKELLKPLGAAIVGLGQQADGGFIIEARFPEEPPAKAHAVKSIRGIPIHVLVDGDIEKEETT